MTQQCQLLINGQPFDIPGQTSMAELLKCYEAKAPYVVALNRLFVPKSEYGSTQVNPGDQVEILQPIQGG